jgi:hypothetical protein
MLDSQAQRNYQRYPKYCAMIMKKAVGKSCNDLAKHRTARNRMIDYPLPARACQNFPFVKRAGGFISYL